MLPGCWQLAHAVGVSLLEFSCDMRSEMWDEIKQRFDQAAHLAAIINSEQQEPLTVGG